MLPWGNFPLDAPYANLQLTAAGFLHLAVVHRQQQILVLLGHGEEVKRHTMPLSPGWEHGTYETDTHPFP